MSYFDTWNKKIEDSSDQTKYTQYVQRYYELERQAYDRILSAYPDNSQLISATASEMASVLGFPPDEMDVFLGFLDGISSSVEDPIQLEEVTDETAIDLKIDYEKLYWNMRDAKADWLYNLASWDTVLPKERRAEITKDFRRANIAHVEKIGRNDPCPCGSGKKFKNCCMGKN